MCETCKNAATTRQWDAREEVVLAAAIARHKTYGGNLQALAASMFFEAYCAPVPCPAPGCAHVVKGG